ncbi:aminodeoxychorismate synthase component I [Microbacterium sp. YY-03]|uniref:aminodeoxychorismate synthase component I n=1 Tax=Microbacterium sp. YY-03 TaxID=3421636 RepID=UPI003D18107F
MSSNLTAVKLRGWVSPDALFYASERRADVAFYLDAGAEASAGWSYLGVGARVALDEALDVVVRSSDGEWPAGPFRGGWITWLGYDDAAARAGAPAVDAERGVAISAESFLAFDLAARVVWAVAPVADAEAFAAATQQRLDAEPEVPLALAAQPHEAVARHTAAEYAADIEACREAIRQGDAYQLCMTTRFTVAGAHDAADVFLRLRAATPSHHAAYIRVGETTLVSASPEQFVTIEGARISTKPIKGTRPRGETPQEDARLAAELLASEKERAENVMIVDLMRNDLSRICTPGSVRVDKLWHVESYRAVHQLVSTVSGQVAAGTTVSDVLDATFPAGSMTGAPKLSAMTILHGLERGGRGVYSGCFGWISHDGSADLAMVIRTVIVGTTEAYVGAGGGITWGSIAADEVAEVAIKARAPLAALGARVAAEWEPVR